ncbi:hypothetical protein DPMN_097804 [Dreissena polymorpha]|uniref:Uncharacterized protein n=1 Tax=Dreissena polymorpha TaxID=45954 RepID=A0A9D4R6P1_DREPO|nr:hypothetical protein DPMN_097804 [Dreissena polymorpha]
MGIGYRSRLLFKARFSVGPLPWVALPSPATRNVGYEAHAPYPRRCLTGWVDENVSEHGLNKRIHPAWTYYVTLVNVSGLEERAGKHPKWYFFVCYTDVYSLIVREANEGASGQAGRQSVG